jgi:Ala-tRNA(Pro) deacylase
MEKKLKKYFENNQIDYREHKHEAVFTVKESKSIKSKIAGLHTKSLFLRDNLGNFYLICLKADKRLDIKTLRKKLKVKKIHFASEPELKKHLKVSPGSVSIFTLIHTEKVKLVLDKEIWLAETVGFHPNINTSTLEIKHKDLEKFYNSLKNEKEVMEL